MSRLYLFILSGLLLIFFACRQEEPAAESITLTKGHLSLTIEPDLGGRISSFRLGEREILKTDRDRLDLQWGSTAWTSPQSDWNWPPIATFDREPFTVSELREGVILLESAQDPNTYLRMRKRISMGDNSDIGITYWVTNEGPSSVKVALWENTRVPYGGYFSFRSDSVRASLETSPVETKDSTSFIYLDERHTERQKVFADLREVPVSYHHKGLVLRKYTGVKELYRTAPKQAPLEIYLDPASDFAEFELQGDYILILPGESANLRVRWELLEE